MISELKNKIYALRNSVVDWCAKHLNKTALQIIGYTATILAYVVFAANRLKPDFNIDPHLVWIGLAVFAGIPELILIYSFKTTITRFGRLLLPKSVDVAVMIALIPLTWLIFGAEIAGIGFVHFLSSHYGEIQPKR